MTTVSWKTRDTLMKRGSRSRRETLRGLASLCLLPTLAMPARGGEPVMSLLELRRRHVMVQEWDLSCGAAALGTLLRYQYGMNVEERELVAELIQREIYLENPELVRLQQGFSLLDLRRVAEGRGFEGLGFGRLDMEDLLGLAPVITPIDPKGYNHFVVVLGQVGDTMQIADPAFGNMTMSMQRFERVWMDFPDIGHVGFVIRNGNQDPTPGNLVPDERVFLTPPPAMIRNTLSR